MLIFLFNIHKCIVEAPSLFHLMDFHSTFFPIPVRSALPVLYMVFPDPRWTPSIPPEVRPSDGFRRRDLSALFSASSAPDLRSVRDRPEIFTTSCTSSGIAKRALRFLTASSILSPKPPAAPLISLRIRTAVSALRHHSDPFSSFLPLRVSGPATNLPSSPSPAYINLISATSRSTRFCVAYFI